METYCIIGLENLIYEGFYIDYTVNITSLTYVDVISN